MYLSVDSRRLRDHMIYLRQELDLSKQLLDRLREQQQIQMELNGIVPDIYDRHIQFARDLQERIREREKLLEHVAELMGDAEWKLSEAASAGLELLEERSIGAGSY